jgi:hypothetical protein
LQGAKAACPHGAAACQNDASALQKRLQASLGSVLHRFDKCPRKYGKLKWRA